MNRKNGQKASTICGRRIILIMKNISTGSITIPNVKTQNALEAKILRQTHVIEKGMSLSHPREKFGVQKAMELLDFIGEFVECGYNIKDSAPVMNALGVLRAYLAYHEERGFKPEEVLKKFEKYSMYLLEKEQYGCRSK